jgi:multiple sugar transport system permease protein
MAPAIILISLRNTLLAIQAGFVPGLIVTDGEPRRSTTFIPHYVREQAFQNLRLGYAALLSLTIAVFAALTVLAHYAIARRLRTPAILRRT